MMIKSKYFRESVKVQLILYKECKYTAGDFPFIETGLMNVSSYHVVDGEDAAKLEKESDGSMIDPYHEYLVIHHSDNGRATFRNSYVDMFLIN